MKLLRLADLIYGAIHRVVLVLGHTRDLLQRVTSIVSRLKLRREINRVINALRDPRKAKLRSVIQRRDLITIDLVGDDTKCGPKCRSMIKTWGNWILSNFSGALPASEFRAGLPPDHEVASRLGKYAVPATPLAMIAVPRKYEDYLVAIGPKSRNMLRKVERKGYTFGQFAYNDRLQDIFEINTSKEERGGRRMSQRYRERPQATTDDNTGYCSQHQVVWYGCFLRDKLVAYCCMHYVRDLGVINIILGHGTYLSDGVMNGLIASMVRDCVEKRSVKYINYLTLFSGSTKLIGFKKRVGFKSYVAFVDVQKFGDVSGRTPDPTARPNPIRRLAHGAKHLVMPW